MIARRPTNQRSQRSSILFVCGGNTCRSPIAVGLARALFGPAVKVASAGVDAGAGGRPAANAVRAMREMGIDISRHRPRGLSAVSVGEYDHVVAMDRTVAALLEETGLVEGRSLIVWNVRDPFRGDLGKYRETVRKIKDLLVSDRKSLVEKNGNRRDDVAQANRRG